VSAPTKATAATYRLEPIDETGVLMGLSMVQCALCGAGVLGTTLAFTAGLPALLSLGPLSGGVAASFVRVGGLALWRWLPALVGWATSAVSGRRSWRARLPLMTDHRGAAVPLPPVLEGLEVMELDWRGHRRVAAVLDRAHKTLCVLVPVAGPSFALEEAGDQERLLAGWGDQLAGHASERAAVRQIGWSDLAAPSGLQAHVAWLDTLEPAEDAPLASYRALLDEASPSATAHEVVVWALVGLGASHPPGKLRSLEERLAAAATTALDSLLRALPNAGLSPGPPLSRPELYQLLRRRADPLLPPPPAAAPGAPLAERVGLAGPLRGGPLAMETSWRQTRVDDTFHRSWWVEAWPRTPVYPVWLGRFMATGGCVRATTVAFEPVPTAAARRRLTRDLTRLESDAEVRTTKGRRVDARHRRATAALLEREEELVAGYAEVAFVGVVTVSAASVVELEEAAQVFAELANQAGVSVRPLSGRQDVGWAAGLPLGLVRHTLVAA